MSTITNSDDFRRAICNFEAELVERTQLPLYRPFVEQRRALARAVDGLDLTPREWAIIRWFLDWDNIDELASIITKAREQGAGLTPATAGARR